jgi:hypothetical protein
MHGMIVELRTLRILKISQNLLKLAYSKDDFHACNESLASRTKHKTYRILRLRNSKSISCKKLSLETVRNGGKPQLREARELLGIFISWRLWVLDQ